MGRDASFVVVQGFIYEDFRDELEPLFYINELFDTSEDFLSESGLGRFAWENSEEIFIGNELKYFDWDDGFIKKPEIPSVFDEKRKQEFIRYAKEFINKDNKEFMEKLIELYEKHCEVYAYCDYW